MMNIAILLTASTSCREMTVRGVWCLSMNIFTILMAFAMKRAQWDAPHACMVHVKQSDYLLDCAHDSSHDKTMFLSYKLRHILQCCSPRGIQATKTIPNWKAGSERNSAQRKRGRHSSAVPFPGLGSNTYLYLQIEIEKLMYLFLYLYLVKI